MKKKCLASVLVVAVLMLGLVACSGTGETPGPDGSATPAISTELTTEPMPESTPEPTPPGEEIASGECGENVTWTLDSNGLLTISGTGPMAEYFDGGHPWRMLSEDYDEFEHPELENIRKVVIEDGVTSISCDSFCFCVNLASVTIPASVTSIGSQAFAYCSSLTSVTIPGSATSIGYGAFQDCSSLTSVTIGNGVTSIEPKAFSGCISLTSVTIPDSVTFIDEYAFQGCSSLTSVTIPDSVNLLLSAFQGCSSLVSIEVAGGNANYTSVDGVLFNADQTVLHLYPAGKNDSSYSIPNSVTFINGGAFEDCSSLTSVTIPDNVTIIGNGAFRGCSSLTSVIIPDGVTSIKSETFQGCTSLTSVTIPDSVTSIGDSAFEECLSLTDVYYGGNEEQWKQITNPFFSHGNDPLRNAAIHYNS